MVPDLPLHIVHRGNNRLPCFRKEGDYLVYLALLKQASEKFACSVHAYCLMGNHVHLLVTPGDTSSCGAMMHGVAQRYAHYFNSSTERTGTLWEGRYRSCVVESARYVLACYRYIELNPVRAGIVSHPEAYAWSSYACNSGARSDLLVTPHAEVEALGRSAYVALVAESLGATELSAIREATNGGFPLATDSFKSALASSAGRRVAPGRAGRPKKTVGKSVDVPDLGV